MRPMIKTSHILLRARKPLALLLLGVLVFSPIAIQAGFLEQALSFGKDLLATAAGNYTNRYQQDLTQLLQAIQQPGTTNQPLLQGIIPGNTHNPNDSLNQNPYGQNDPYGSNPNDRYQYEQGYGQENQQDDYAGSNFPSDPNYGNDSGDYANPYQQDEGYGDPTNSYGSNPPYGHSSQGQGYDDPYNPQQEYPSQEGNDDPYQTSNPQQPYDTQSPYQDPNHPNPALEQGIQLDVVIVKKAQMNGAETMIPIKDGDVLKDGRGHAQAGDKFRVMFRTNSNCYVYVIAIDGSAWAQGIFPSLTSPFANPVKQGQQYIIPENNNWLSLDQFKGIETLFFVASPEKRQDIEDILSSIAGKERHPKATPQQVTKAPIIPAGFHRSQRSSTPFIIGQTVSRPQGLNQGLIPTTYFTQKAGEALRVTRWFRHE